MEVTEKTGPKKQELKNKLGAWVVTVWFVALNLCFLRFSIHRDVYSNLQDNIKKIVEKLNTIFILLIKNWNQNVF